MEPVRSPYGPPSAVLQWKAEERPKGGRRGAEGTPYRLWGKSELEIDERLQVGGDELVEHKDRHDYR